MRSGPSLSPSREPPKRLRRPQTDFERVLRRRIETAVAIGKVELDSKLTGGYQAILLQLPSEHTQARRNRLDFVAETAAGPGAAISRLPRSQAVGPGVQCQHSPAQGDESR